MDITTKYTNFSRRLEKKLEIKNILVNSLVSLTVSSVRLFAKYKNCCSRLFLSVTSMKVCLVLTPRAATDTDLYEEASVLPN